MYEVEHANNKKVKILEIGDTVKVMRPNPMRGEMIPVFFEVKHTRKHQQRSKYL